MGSVSKWLTAKGFLLNAGVALLAVVPSEQVNARKMSPENASERDVASSGVPSGDIVVTARRQEERLQDVPVAVSAFGAEALAERRILSETDLQSATPGLTVRSVTSSNQLNYAIRGQSIDSFSYTAPAVVSYFNEVQAGGTTATAFFDLSSIQVLKGPQGTLFGRNATGGAVLYESAKPKLDKMEGYLTAGYGNFDNREIEGAINLPLSSFAAIRVAGRYQKRDGYQRNLYNGQDQGSVDASTIRGSLLLESGDGRFQNVAVVQYGRYKGRSLGLKMCSVNGADGTPLNTNFADT